MGRVRGAVSGWGGQRSARQVHLCPASCLLTHLPQELLAVLTPFTSAKEQQPGENKDPQGARFQCLRCSCEFKPEESRLALESDEGWKPLFQNTGISLGLPGHLALPPQGRCL